MVNLDSGHFRDFINATTGPSTGRNQMTSNHTSGNAADNKAKSELPPNQRPS